MSDAEPDADAEPDDAAKPIRIYGLDPAGATPVRWRSLIAGGFLLFLAASCVVPSLSNDLANLASKLPWMRVDLLPYGAAALTLFALPLLWRAWRLKRARQGRAVLHADHLLIAWGDANLSLRPADIAGYSLPHGEYVQLHVPDLPSRTTVVPTPNDVIRALVVDWLEGHGVSSVDG